MLAVSSAQNLSGLSAVADAQNLPFHAVQQLQLHLNDEELAGLGWVYVDANNPFQNAVGTVAQVPDDTGIGVFGSQVTYLDFPSTHVSHDLNFLLRVDPGYENLVSTVNEFDHTWDGVNKARATAVHHRGSVEPQGPGAVQANRYH